MFLSGIVYMIFNAIGSAVMGKGIYPAPFDWSNVWITAACWFVQAPVLYLLNEMIATCTQKRRNFIEQGY
jgi:hypothetical protein